METIISAGISTVGAIVICIITQVVLANKQTQEIRTDTREQTALFKGEIDVVRVRLDNITAKVEKHNNFIERVYELERRADVQDAQLDGAERRLNDLEQRTRQ